jgi:hypothetical protein
MLHSEHVHPQEFERRRARELRELKAALKIQKIHGIIDSDSCLPVLSDQSSPHSTESCTDSEGTLSESGSQRDEMMASSYMHMQNGKMPLKPLTTLMVAVNSVEASSVKKPFVLDSFSVNYPYSAAKRKLPDSASTGQFNRKIQAIPVDGIVALSGTRTVNTFPQFAHTKIKSPFAYMAFQNPSVFQSSSSRAPTALALPQQLMQQSSPVTSTLRNSPISGASPGSSAKGYQNEVSSSNTVASTTPTSSSAVDVCPVKSYDSAHAHAHSAFLAHKRNQGIAMALPMAAHPTSAAQQYQEVLVYDLMAQGYRSQLVPSYMLLNASPTTQSAATSPSLGSVKLPANGSTRTARASPATVPIPSKKGARSEQGNTHGQSCHQCKAVKPGHRMVMCCGTFAKSGRRTCKKKYCMSCIAHYAHKQEAQLHPTDNSPWSCYSCTGCCLCAACTRKRSIV